MANLGEVRMYCGKTVPPGWMPCDGRLLRVDEYTDLFVLFDTTYGGDGQTTFGIPDLRGRVPVHRGPTVGLGQKGGAESVTLTVANLAQHSHDFNATAALADQPSPVGNTTAQSGTLQLYTQPDPTDTLYPLDASALAPANGDGRAHENMHPYVVVTYILAVEGLLLNEEGAAT